VPTVKETGKSSRKCQIPWWPREMAKEMWRPGERVKEIHSFLGGSHYPLRNIHFIDGFTITTKEIVYSLAV
jgi:hypothetical protein